MCGSGTLLIEAAMLSGKIPAAYFKPEFGFMKWKDYEPELWYKIKEEEDEKMVNAGCIIRGCDISSRAIDSVMQNIRFAKLINRIKVEVSPYESYIPPEGNGIVVTMSWRVDEYCHCEERSNEAAKKHVATIG
jgi:23S rRNA G2445 N2-methylase RlmL